MKNTKRDVESLDSARFIAHIDLDCFYAQVEGKRLGLHPEKPLCVVQWGMVLASNYAARPHGVQRGISSLEVKKRCPVCVVVHVDTVDAHGEIMVAEDGNGNDSIAADRRSKGKVCLERYRMESAKIFSVITAYCDSVERASIDEAFLDWSQGAMSLDQAAQLTLTIREQIREQLGYTCSAGIAHNKMLAKMVSAKSKPNQQAVLRPYEVPALLAVTRLERFRGLGGKLGRILRERFRCQTMADVALLSKPRLREAFEEKTAIWIMEVARGLDTSAVRMRTRPDRLLAAKSFRPVYSWVEIRHWLQILATELDLRLERDRQRHHRVPRSLMVTFSCGDEHQELTKFSRRSSSRSCGFPVSAKVKRCEAMVEMAERLLRATESVFRFPCMRLGLQAYPFIDVAEAAGSIKQLFGTRVPENRVLNEAENSGGLIHEKESREPRGTVTRENGSANESGHCHESATEDNRELRSTMTRVNQSLNESDGFSGLVKEENKDLCSVSTRENRSLGASFDRNVSMRQTVVSFWASREATGSSDLRTGDPRHAPLAEMGFAETAIAQACRATRTGTESHGLEAAIEWILGQESKDSNPLPPSAKRHRSITHYFVKK